MACKVRLDLVAGTKDFTKIKSVQYEKDIENGMVLAIDTGLVDGKPEVYKGAIPTATTKHYVLVASPEVISDNNDPRKDDLVDFINVANLPLRGYILDGTTSIFSVTDDCLDGTPAVGSVVELQASKKMKVVKTATSGSTVVGKIIAIDTVQGEKFNVIEVQ